MRCRVKVDRELEREKYVAAAQRRHQDEGTLEIDEGATVSDSGDSEEGGCYVQAWVWVTDEDAGVSFEEDE